MKCKQKRAEEALFGREEPTVKLFRLEEPREFERIPSSGWETVDGLKVIQSVGHKVQGSFTSDPCRNPRNLVKSRLFLVPFKCFQMDLTLDRGLVVNNQQL